MEKEVLKIQDTFSVERLHKLLKDVEEAENKVRDERGKCRHDYRPLKQEYNIYTNKCAICGGLKIDEY